MKKDVRKKERVYVSAARIEARRNLVTLLKLSQELETVYQTYPKLRNVVGHEAWTTLTDIVYAQLLDLNLNPTDPEIRERVAKNIERLEDLSASTLVRDQTGLRDTVSRVLIFRLSNNLVTQ